MFLLPVIVGGCGKDKGPSVEEMLLGSWTQYKGKAHSVFMIKAQGGWSSDIRMEGSTSRIIEKRGSASGTWQVDGKQIVITVVDSTIEDLWERGKTIFCEIVELNKDIMTLKYPDGKVQTWNRAKIKKGPDAVELPRVIKIKPLVVNLNKIRSHDKDRYLCLDLELNLKDALPDAPIPILHPRAREAMILFLSSLIYKDVKTLDGVKQVVKNLEVMLNPYLDNTLDNIKINHVVISSTMDKVDEFLIEHTPQPEPVVPPDEENKKGDK